MIKRRRQERCGPAGRPTDKPYEAELSKSERAVIEHAPKHYGSYTGRELSEMTHQEGTPWRNGAGCSLQRTGLVSISLFPRELLTIFLDFTA